MNLAKRKIIPAAILFLIVALIFTTFSLFYNMLPKRDQTTVTFNITKGASLSQVATSLKRDELIPSTWRFKLLARLKGKAEALQWGEYELSRAAHPVEILHKLTQGKVKTYKVTVPEGLAIKEIGKLLEDRELTNAKDFTQFALSVNTEEVFGIPGPTLEGYLYPTTYFLRRGLTTKEIAGEMVGQYKKVFTDELRKRARQLNLNEREVITLASIIEKETGVLDERELISAVFHNRLRRGMRLQADPTVIYGIKNYNGNITKKHLQTYTPYNTYRIKGLPPGPIANPGVAAIKAALYPTESDYLYFVADRKGAHVFSKTYAEHSKNVYLYQIKRSK